LRLSTAAHFSGRFTPPGDKSIGHRLAILGALAVGETRIRRFPSAADCASTLGCLEALGVEVRREGADVVIHGRGPEAWTAPAATLDAGNSGSTLRMLAGALAGRPFLSVLSGDDSLRRRPVERVAAPLRAMGARAEGQDGRPPLAIEGGALRGIDWELKVPSAQVKTAVLLAGLQADGVTRVREPLPSRDHTERLLPLFGADFTRGPAGLEVRRTAALRPVDLVCPGDPSAAAFLVVAALVRPGSRVRLDGVLLNPTRVAFLDVLRSMGADVETGIESEVPEPVGWIEARSSRLHGVTVPPQAVPALIDEVPALAVAAACAEGEFTLTGAEELRVKESDRIAALAEGLTRLGASFEERADGFMLRGGRKLQGARVRGHGDHRIAMALAVAALAAEGTTEIEDAECVAVSFPEFPAVLEAGTRG
jgi:3-phosphoshikimate 1-carboxyvinyltransferase